MIKTKTTANGAGAEALAAQLAADTALQPGEAGYWEVWGARTWHIRPGDVIVTLDGSGGLYLDEVATAEEGTARVRLTTTTGTRFTLGHLAAKWKLFRQGTHHTLAG